MSDGAGDDGLETLLEHLRLARAVDFRNYKRASLGRRIAKRMATVGAADYDGYVEHLRTDPDEFEVLFNTILINVTSFFRDRAAWDFLRGTVIPRSRPGPTTRRSGSGARRAPPARRRTASRCCSPRRSGRSATAPP
jgi:chemotaxis methyl-accepting protein methylase